VATRYFNTGRREEFFVTTSNLTVPADGFRTIGGFNPRFLYSEDRDLGARWRERGLGIAFAPEVVVGHDRRFTVRDLWMRHFHIGRGTYRFHEARQARGGGFGRPDFRFYGRLLAYPFGSMSAPRAVLCSALIVFTQVANVAGYWSERTFGRRMD
jgi:GT2 family glycosyltransferase